MVTYKFLPMFLLRGRCDDCGLSLPVLHALARLREGQHVQVGRVLVLCDACLDDRGIQPPK